MNAPLPTGRERDNAHYATHWLFAHGGVQVIRWERTRTLDQVVELQIAEPLMRKAFERRVIADYSAYSAT